MTRRKKDDEVRAFHMPKDFETLTSLYDSEVLYDEDLHEHIIVGEVIEYTESESIVRHIGGAIEFIAECSEDFLAIVDSLATITTHRGVTKQTQLSPEVMQFMSQKASPFEKRLFCFITISRGQKMITRVTTADDKKKVRVKMFNDEKISASTYRPIIESKNIDVIMIGKKSFKNAKEDKKGADKKITF